MPFASALSEHPDPSEAIGEVIGAILESHGPAPDLAVLFVTGAHLDAVRDLVATVSTLLQPGHLTGATAVSVVGGPREVERRPAVSLWAAWFAAPVEIAHLEAVRNADGLAVLGIEMTEIEKAAAVLLFADPLTFPLDELLASVRAGPGHTPIVGGVASAGFHPGGNRLIHDGEVHSSGAVAVLIPPDAVGVSTVVSQGCRPVGDPFTVTRADRNLVLEIAGRPAYARLVELLDSLPEEDRELARQGLHLGRVIDDHKLDFERGDFLVRNLAGADRTSGAVAVNDVVDVGATVQFQVRDADAADDDLRALLTGRHADAALLFTCNGRGTSLFGRPDHDAEVVTDYLDRPPLAGMFCAGEIGPVGGQSFLHGFTASLALFHDLPTS